MQLLEKLTMCDGASGYEKSVRNIIIEEASKYADECTVTPLGSVVARLRGGENAKKIMFDAHIDEIGVIATYIDKNGFIRFGSVGGLYTSELRRRRVRFGNGTVGVIGAEDEKFDENPRLSHLYIDIGANSREEADKLVKVGDTAVFCGEYVKQGDTVISKALDDRAGCFILLETLAAMSGTEHAQNDLYFVFSTQEEVGFRGALTAAYGIMPDYAIAVDVTDTGDTPSAPTMAVKLSGGAAVKIMDDSVMSSVYVVNALDTLAEKNGIPYQHEIMADGGTDAGAIALTGAGVRAGGISVPTRYIHSPAEMASISDIKACTDLAKAACLYNWE